MRRRVSIYVTIALVLAPSTVVAELRFVPDCIVDLKPSLENQKIPHLPLNLPPQPLAACKINRGQNFTYFSAPAQDKWQSTAVFENSAIEFISNEIVQTEDAIFLGGKIDQDCPNGYVPDHIYIKYDRRMCSLTPELKQ